MVCFCKQSIAPLTATLQAMATATATLSLDTSASLRVSAVADWMAARGLPQAPWQADPLWLELALPTPRLSLQAMATLSALAQIRAQALTLGIDLTASASATATARLVATLNARLSALASLDLSLDVSVLLRLAAQLEAAEQVTLAASLNLFLPTPELMLSYTAPGGIALDLWLPFLDAVASLSPLIALSVQLGISDAAALSVAIRAMLSIEVPVLAELSLALQLMAGLSAAARIQAILGVDVTAIATADLAAMVALRVEAALALIPPGAGPPRIARCPTLSVTPAVVSLAASAEIALLAAIDWNVPALPSLSFAATLMPALTLSASLNAVARVPCGVCDALALLKAL